MWKYPRWIEFVDSTAEDGDGEDPALPAAGAVMRAGTLAGRDGTLETGWWGPGPGEAPTLVLLHEGLGCVALWRDVPERLAAATGWGVFAYSRFGYGRSDRPPCPGRWRICMTRHRRCCRQVLHAAGIGQAVLVGHSDGGSIAAIYAGIGRRWAGEGRPPTSDDIAAGKGNG